MANCKNCGKSLGCTCQVRTSNSGVSGCTSCIGSLNSSQSSSRASVKVLPSRPKIVLKDKTGI
jgi:hypothetical protein